MKNNFRGLNAVITGASRGLGFAIAQAFVRKGINILICSRDNNELAQAQRKLRAINPNVKIFIRQTDISKENEIKDFCAYALEVFNQIHILVNNAGIYGPMGAFDEIDFEEFKKCMDINFYGSVLMCKELLPHFKKNEYGRIIQISGGGATQAMPNIEGYASSKCAIVRFIESIAQSYKSYNIYANCISPGLLDTNMLNQVIAIGEKAAGKDFYDRMIKAKNERKTASFEHAQKLCLFLISEESDAITGKLISALWDDYENWTYHLDELSESDIYTLRRITGRDRNCKWGDK